MTRHRGLLYRFLRGLLLLGALVGLSLLGFIWYVGAWGVVFPSHQHDTVAPVLPAGLESPAVLVFSKTNGFRHKEGIEGGAMVLGSIARERSWGYFHTENGAVFNPEGLARFDTVVFLNASGDMLSLQQEQAFQQWLLAGGGWLGIHAAGDGSHAGWQWYMDEWIGTEFTAHILSPQFQRATVVLENQQHPALSGLPDIWDHEEEWYSWASSPRQRGFKILATLDEDSYTPVQKILSRERDLRMGDHPVVWSNCVGGGRSLYFAMGHRAEAFTQPQVRQIMENALVWLTGESSQAGC
jgi:type 1 glutamine amidotransferase